VAELADALDSGLSDFLPFLYCSNRAEPFDNTGDNALFELPHGAIERKAKLAQKLAQLSQPYEKDLASKGAFNSAAM